MLACRRGRSDDGNVVLILLCSNDAGIDRPELRFLVERGLQMLPRGVLRDLAGSENVRSRALELATDIVTERLDHLEYDAPDPLRNHGAI